MDSVARVENLKPHQMTFYKIWVRIILSCLLICLPSITLASETSDARTRILNIHVDRILTSVKTSLRGVGKYIEDTDLEEADYHEFLGTEANLLEGVRAIIVIDENGMLRYDSFSYPAPNVDLSDRDYFQLAQNGDDQFHLGKEVLFGKTSGLAFIPLIHRITNEGEFNGTVVAILNPDSLILNENLVSCGHCISFLVSTDDQIYAKWPQGYDITDLKNRLDLSNRASQGSINTKSKSLDATASWIRNTNFPLISVVVEISP